MGFLSFPHSRDTVHTNQNIPASHLSHVNMKNKSKCVPIRNANLLVKEKQNKETNHKFRLDISFTV